MNRVKNPYTERTLIFAGVLVAVGGIIAGSSKYVPVEYLSSGIGITGIGIAFTGATMLVFVAIMECKYGRC